MKNKEPKETRRENALHEMRQVSLFPLIMPFRGLGQRLPRLALSQTLISLPLYRPCLKKHTSPSCTSYSLPWVRLLPAALTALSEPTEHAREECEVVWITSEGRVDCIGKGEGGTEKEVRVSVMQDGR